MKKTEFRDYPLSMEILRAVQLLNYKNPTQVQERVIPAILEEKDVIVKSQTGSGKTAAFAIPVSHLVDWEENKPQALVITPTRELALQVKEEFFNIGRFKRLKVPAIFGKDSYRNQERDLKQKAHVVVGTPGRLIDHIERGTFDTSMIKYLVIDEADEMLKMGFIEQIETIIENLPKNIVKMLLSATMPEDIDGLCRKYIKDPVVVEIESKDPAKERINQEKYITSYKRKFNLLKDVLTVENPDSCIVFCSTKQRVNDVCNHLNNAGFPVGRVHGGMEQRDRISAMNDFKRGKFRYLIATDVAARGIDVDDIKLVVNLDLPFDTESYVHRIGRTGRIGKSGKAISFVTEKDERFLQAIEEHMEKELTLKEKPTAEEVEEASEAFNKKALARPKVKASKSKELTKEIMKLHINAGKKTKMRPVDIVGTLCNIPGMTADDIGIINIIDVSTFVEILNNKGDMVFKALQSKPIKGRIRKVSKAHDDDFKKRR